MLGVRLDAGPLLFSSDDEYLLVYATAVEQAAELRAKYDQAMANRIANAFNGKES